MNKQLRVVIIGGGIGGAASAIALQNEGIPAEIYEQAKAIKEVGAAIVLRPATMRLFKKWGIYDEIVHKSVHSEFMEIRTEKGDIVQKERWPLITENPDENWAELIHRADLLDTLLAQIPSDSIHLNHKCESIIEHENDVEVRFLNGTSVYADLVIAADGIHSVARKMFSDDEPVFAREHTYRAIVNREEVLDLISDDTAITLYQGDKTHVLLLPVRPGAAQFSVDVIVPSEDSSWRLKVEKEEILEYLKDFSPKIQELINNIESTIDARAIHDRKPIECWTSNYITLLGDAAHATQPNQGLGGNMAIEDADALVEALREATTIPEALKKYEAHRKPITSKIQNLSRQDQVLDFSLKS
ncbi:FAD-dependent monooxygenase [Peribacillus sp. NPDC096379]|uniref:FAD-dependent monooxygenase n=1 Tax=Peribacillus sp. NPDC096379 TaxID=3364393 RepID=UPI003815C931